MTRSVRCAVCGRKARVTKLDTLARHRDEYGHVCDNTGVSETSAGRASRTQPPGEGPPVVLPPDSEGVPPDPFYLT